MGAVMAENEAQSGRQTAIVPVQERHWLRLPDESAQAYSALRAYLDVDPGKRSIAAAYRQLKGLDADAKVRVPGYFGAWAARFRWQQRADAWDVFLDQLAIVVNAEELAAARKQTAELSARLMGFVETELRRWRARPGPGLRRWIRRVRGRSGAMSEPNWTNWTMWTGDNLDIMRGMNSVGRPEPALILKEIDL